MDAKEFEAISYVWGSDLKDHEIFCRRHAMKITTNQSKVLRRVRFPHAPRNLWADYICIDQDNKEEKGHQVAIMGEIYRSAKRVLIYMGSDDDGHGQRLCSLLEDVNTMIDDTCKRIDMSWDSFPWPDQGDPILVDVRWKSMYHLLSEDWFERGWVVREAAVARDGQVMWGQSEFNWEDFIRTYIWLIRRGLRPYNAGNFVKRAIGSHFEPFRQRYKSFVQTFHPETTWPSQYLLRYLDYAKRLQLSDPRDRIYAFMEHSRDSEHPITIHLDYNASHLDFTGNLQFSVSILPGVPVS
jgi:hypothetical protein